MIRSADGMKRDVQEAMKADEVRFVLTWAITLGDTPNPGDGLRVEYKSYGTKSWRKAGVALYPAEGQTVESIFGMLMDMRREAKGEPRLDASG